jgi:DNA polymerase III alpha subunit
MRLKTGYSFKTAVGSLEEGIARLKALGATEAPIADRCSTFGWTRWCRLAENVGLRPVLGVDLAMVPRLGEKKPSPSYVTMYAKDDIAAVHAAIAKATWNVTKEPMLTYEQALTLPGLIKIADEKLRVDELPKDFNDETYPDFYVALSPSVSKGLARLVNDNGIRWLASSDNYFFTSDDLEFYRVAMGRRGGTQTYPRYLLSQDEWLADMATKDYVTDEMIVSAVANKDWAIDQCRATLRKGKLLKPERPKTLFEMCADGAARLGVSLEDGPYAERLERELKLIEEKDFEDYFFIVADLIAWAKQVMMVGPGRGSSAGSLVCYLLGITAIDPLEHGLLFERFIDVSRNDSPDIDIDFDDTRRDLVFRYAAEKYGADRVARLGTVGFFKEKSAMNQVCASLKIPKWKADDPLDRVLKDYPEAAIVERLEGHPSHSSQHAAGLLLTDEPTTAYVAIDSRTGAAWCDKKDAEQMNLLKIDALGLTQMGVFGRCMELISKPVTSAWLESLPYDDASAFEVFNRKQYSGVFQFNGNALRGLAASVKVESLDDIATLSALARPGPLDSGAARIWVARRNGHDPNWRDHVHPLLLPIVEGTLGVLIFQEQTMRAVREIGGFSWEDTSRVRRLIQYKDAMDEMAPPFIAGAQVRGMSQYDAEAIWNQITTFGSYGFNLSHAVAYGVVSYWCAYLKAHHPAAFAAATLDAEADPAKQIAILRELAAEDMGYVPLDVNRSVDRWTLSEDGKLLIGPLTTVKGIGPAKLQEILDSRRTRQPLRPTLQKQLEGASTSIDTLFPIRDAIRRLHPDLTASANIVSEPWEIADCQCGVRGEVLVLGVVNRVTVKDENAPENVAKRGYEIKPPFTKSLNLFIQDDTDECLAKIDRRDWERLGADVALAQAKPGKSLYAIKGTIPPGFRMLSVKRIRYLGEMT